MPAYLPSGRASQDPPGTSQASHYGKVRFVAVALGNDIVPSDSCSERQFRGLHSCGRSTLLVSLPLWSGVSIFANKCTGTVMLSLAIGSGLMIAVTIKYVQSRQKFTQWSPPKFSSATSASDSGTYTSGTQNSPRPLNSGSTGGKGLYDRWLMVRFTIAFILLA